MELGIDFYNPQRMIPDDSDQHKRKSRSDFVQDFGLRLNTYETNNIPADFGEVRNKKSVTVE